MAFLAICQGEQLSIRMDKVCTGFRVNIYPCPETKDERLDMIIKLNTRISDLEQVCHRTDIYTKVMSYIKRKIAILTRMLHTQVFV